MQYLVYSGIVDKERFGPQDYPKVSQMQSLYDEKDLDKTSLCHQLFTPRFMLYLNGKEKIPSNRAKLRLVDSRIKKKKRKRNLKFMLSIRTTLFIDE